MATESLRIERHDGDREALRPLFEPAEDSPAQLDCYIEAGTVLVAVSGDELVGHLQLVETARREAREIKNTAVSPLHQRRGVGRSLVCAAVELARHEQGAVMRVATAAADTGNLRFYQRLGFRVREIERDAFTAAGGYPPGTRVEGIELRDRVWLDLELGG